jgi:hypothetical protein
MRHAQYTETSLPETCLATSPPKVESTLRESEVSGSGSLTIIFGCIIYVEVIKLDDNKVEKNRFQPKFPDTT